MQRIAAREAKNSFGRLIDMARAEPVAIEKHGRAVVVVIAFEEYERLAGRDVARGQDAKGCKPSAEG
ncbi:MAG: type II toxin-antitoxin system Phd/YefM family antitoxin [Methylobacterium mesophilicum]|nr:type II toxin-antitoxin system Phd/YefM family antitoxin [Methylobacterium mesophilicum]